MPGISSGVVLAQKCVMLFPLSVDFPLWHLNSDTARDGSHLHPSPPFPSIWNTSLSLFVYPLPTFKLCQKENIYSRSFMWSHSTGFFQAVILSCFITLVPKLPEFSHSLGVWERDQHWLHGVTALKTKNHLTSPVGVVSGWLYSESIQVISPIIQAIVCSHSQKILPENVGRIWAIFNEFWKESGENRKENGWVYNS
jgi:hypothetical protein